MKFQGEFPWRHHDNEDEMYLVWRGEMKLEFRDRVVSLRSGEYRVAPRGVEHRTYADEEAAVIFEPEATRNTGNVVDERPRSLSPAYWEHSTRDCFFRFQPSRCGHNSRWRP